MPVLSVTKIVARPGLLMRLRVARHAMQSMRQAAKMQGCLAAVGAPTSEGSWAVSLWEDEESLRGYVFSGAHGEAAKQSRDVTRTHVASNMPWHDELPHWTEWGTLLARSPHIIDTKHAGDLSEADKLAGPRRVSRLFTRRHVKRITKPAGDAHETRD